MAEQPLSRSRKLNRIIQWLSLAGMVLAVHLWIQKARGFDQGCLGIEKHVVQAGGCTAVNDLPASHLLGVSNAAWGYAFYFALALIAFGRLLVPPNWERRLHIVGELLVLTGFAYTAYLVYLMGAVIHSWCALCTISAAIVALLTIAYAVLRWSGDREPLSPSERSAEVALASGATFLAMGVLVGIVIFVDRLGTRALDEGSTRQEIARLVGDSLPVYIDASKLEEMRACHFDYDAKPLDLKVFVNEKTPFIGKADGTPVIVFFDPNCPHCRQYLPTYLKLVERYKDRLRFTILPRLLWRASLAQGEALKLAEGTGKYFDLWQRMLDRASGPQNKMNEAEIASMFVELGLPTADLERRLAAQEPAVAADIRAANRAGIDAVPAVYVDRWKVWSLNQTEACMARLFDRLPRHREPAATTK